MDYYQAIRAAINLRQRVRREERAGKDGWNETVSFKGMDGSQFKITLARHSVVDGWLLIVSEHYQPIAIHTYDLHDADIGKPGSWKVNGKRRTS